MCGIIGIISLHPQNMTDKIECALRQMKNRGPDDEGAVIFSTAGKTQHYIGDDTPLAVQQSLSSQHPIKHLKEGELNSTIALGHRRLSILDPSPLGHQPMSFQNNRYWIVYNGEIYNFKEIKSQLLSHGYSFTSESDTEVVLKAYAHWGKECLSYFNGMFAFAIYDNKKKKIFLARDRIGIKPLYYCHVNDTFCFSSDIKTLLSTRIISPEINIEGLYHNFAFSMTPRPNTSFKGIYALPPGHFFELDTKTLSIKTHQYWDIPTNIQESSMTEHEAVELLEEELKRSIKLQLVSDVEVGTFMSGGIDSTTISAMASKIHPGIKAFTLAFDKSISKYNELNEAIETASMHNMQHIVSTLNADVILNNIDAMVLGYEEPFPSLAANFAISNIVSKEGVKVVLNGLGGDELFYGYSHYKHLAQWKKIKKFNFITNLLPLGISQKLDNIKKSLSAKNIAEFYANQYMTYDDTLSSNLFGESFGSLSTIGETYLPPEKRFTDDLEKLSYLDMKSYIGNHHVHRTDQFTMHFSIEGRFPFLDHILIENAYRIPSHLKMRNGVQKYALRKVAQKYIAPSCLSMDKKGFGLPLEVWFHKELHEMATETTRALKNRHLFDNITIDRISTKGTIQQKWQLVMTELWLRNFIDVN